MWQYYATMTAVLLLSLFGIAGCLLTLNKPKTLQRFTFFGGVAYDASLNAQEEAESTTRTKEQHNEGL